MKPLALRTLVVVLIALLAGGCAGSQESEQSINSKLADCAKIADRDERTRCIDAAHRSQG